MDSIKKSINKILEVFCVSLLVFMTVVATYQIITRYFLSKPSTISEDLLLFSFIWLSLLSAAYVFGKQEHMAMTFISDKIISKGLMYKKILMVFTEVIIMFFSILILIIGGIQISMLSMQQISPALQIPMGVLYLVIPISGIITIIYNILNIYSIYKLKE